jgi:hypothetical protein
MHDYYAMMMFASSKELKFLLKKERESKSRVNFTNILRVAFSDKSFARSFFVLAEKVKLFIGPRILAQMRL